LCNILVKAKDGIGIFAGDTRQPALQNSCLREILSTANSLHALPQFADGHGG